MTALVTMTMKVSQTNDKNGAAGKSRMVTAQNTNDAGAAVPGLAAFPLGVATADLLAQVDYGAVVKVTVELVTPAPTYVASAAAPAA